MVEALPVALAADLEQQVVSPREPLEALGVVVSERGLQAGGGSQRESVQLAPVEEPGESRLCGQRGVVHLEVDRAGDVTDLVAHDHVGDEGDGEDRDRRQGEHQPQAEPELERRCGTRHELAAGAPAVPGVLMATVALRALVLVVVVAVA